MEIAKRELLSKIYVRVNRESRTKIAAYVDVSRDLPMNSSMISRGPLPALDELHARLPRVEAWAGYSSMIESVTTMGVSSWFEICG